MVLQGEIRCPEARMSGFFVCLIHKEMQKRELVLRSERISNQRETGAWTRTGNFSQCLFLEPFWQRMKGNNNNSAGELELFGLVAR